ncbi:copper resistance CopC family protein [Arthrobacter sp. Soc17.1.1.1]|uniref:copper resistance CopC family protein n=1 Tax=Arthrobacter sp. Soc17.1.1.1 TaxID=3121277 RepID=UPI002FE44ADC
MTPQPRTTSTSTSTVVFASRPRSGRFARMAALLLASTLLLLGPVSAANAHDELAASSPAADASPEVAPTEIVLTFTNPPSGIGADIIVSDSTGTKWSQGPAEVVNNTVRQALRSGAPADTYTAQWRVVSSDDHPIEGTYSFTSTTAQTGSADNPGPAAESSAPSAETGDTASASPQAADPAGSSTGLPDFVIYLAIGGILIAGVLALLTRRLLNKR